jgi:hypothetical protein
MADRLVKVRNQRNILLYGVEEGAAELLKNLNQDMYKSVNSFP